MNLVIGLLLGIAIGGGFWAWGVIPLIIANVICLTAMTSIWLGMSFVPGQATRLQLHEIAAAAITFGIIGLAFAREPVWLCAGFALQAIWCVLHREGSVGASAQDLYPGFAASMNLGFLLVFGAAWMFA